MPQHGSAFALAGILNDLRQFRVVAEKHDQFHLQLVLVNEVSILERPTLLVERMRFLIQQRRRQLADLDVWIGLYRKEPEIHRLARPFKQVSEFCCDWISLDKSGAFIILFSLETKMIFQSDELQTEFMRRFLHGSSSVHQFSLRGLSELNAGNGTDPWLFCINIFFCDLS